MGKKKHNRDGHKHKHKHAGDAAGMHGVAGPLAGIAAVLAKQANSPEARQLLAQGLTMAAAAASAALTKPAPTPATEPAAAAPIPPMPPVPPLPPVPPTPSEGTTKAPDPHEIGVALGKAAEQVLGAFLRRKPGA